MKMNNRKRHRRVLLFLTALFLPILLFGCGTMGNEETPEITPEYLATEYAQQLTNDGAEQLLGSIELSRSDSGDIQMILHPKEIVSDSTQEKGYRIDSFALNRSFYVPEQAHVTYFTDGNPSDPNVLTPAQFYEILTKDYEAQNLSFAEYGDHKLYRVYALDDQVLLILPHEQ